jgi:hypothetical protein
MGWGEVLEEREMEEREGREEVVGEIEMEDGREEC